MLTEENDAGGLSVFLVSGDDLNQVPASHRRLVTPTLVNVFDDPPAYFLGVAGRCPFPQMSAWIRALVDDGAWALGLHRSFRKDWNAAGFSWWSDAVRSAEITPPDGPSPGNLPPALASRCIPVLMFRAGPDSVKPQRRIDEDPAGWQELRVDRPVSRMLYWPGQAAGAGKTQGENTLYGAQPAPRPARATGCRLALPLYV